MLKLFVLALSQNTNAAKVNDHGWDALQFLIYLESTSDVCCIIYAHSVRICFFNDITLENTKRRDLKMDFKDLNNNLFYNNGERTM